MKILVVCLVDAKRFYEHSVFNDFHNQPKLRIYSRVPRGLRDTGIVELDPSNTLLTTIVIGVLLIERVSLGITICTRIST